MSVGLDDKLLGEKSHYYCSSSEDEGEENSDTESGAPAKASLDEKIDLTNYQGTCTNTGPKGVIKDWREFKRLEMEKRQESEQEKQELAKKLSMTCRSYLDDQAEKKKDEELLEELEELEDEFLQQYRERRLEEMRNMLNNVPKFGKVVNLSSASEFLTCVDSEKPQVTIIVHVHELRSAACEAMNGCLMCLAQEYPTVKFCKITATEASLSGHFAESGVPALLVYKNKDLVGNFVRLSDELGDDFFATDVESFLQEHGFLPSGDVMSAIRDKNTGELRSGLPQDNDSGSDFEID